MSWQKCPLCNGAGAQKPHPSLYRPEFDALGHEAQPTCKACLNHGIINESTGLPPNMQPVAFGFNGDYDELTKKYVKDMTGLIIGK